jgi:hypothetical protein
MKLPMVQQGNIMINSLITIGNDRNSAIKYINNTLNFMIREFGEVK